jgi:arylformamidase
MQRRKSWQGRSLVTIIDYDAEYNNRARVPDHPAIIAGWARDAEAYRASCDGDWRTINYGPGERHQIDFFPSSGDGSIVVFIHGGYWQSLDRSYFSHLARGLNARGISVAIPSYDLCPQVSVATIIDQMRSMSRELAKLGERLVISGHSAGGHLAACLLATDWKQIAPDLPADLVTAAYSISGVFDLVPLIGTPLNVALQLDETSAREVSSTFWRAPRQGSLDAVVGAAESGEFLRQSKVMAEIWGSAGLPTRFEPLPEANHFTVIAPMADPQSGMTARLAELAARRA